MSSILEKWFEENQRDFPWRINRTPYRVWISEVMLQQTRASVVIPYFLRWMELFPDVKSLYMASLDQVIKAWEGLGYYSRARNLHSAAREIVEKFGGEIPSSEESLLSIRGFGPYTVGAIRSFAFQQRAAAVDGNVLRVIARYFCIEEDISKNATRLKIAEKAEELLDPQIPWVTAEALIELGATICGVKPRCEICPLQEKCRSFHLGRAEYLPLKKKEKTATLLLRPVFIVKSEGFVLVKKGEKGKVMADLYEFPYIEASSMKNVVAKANKMFKGLEFLGKLTPCSHTFTKYKAQLFPYLFKADHQFPSAFEWVEISRLKELPFSSGHRKILTQLLTHDANK